MSVSGMRILVTGASGFLGRHLVQHLARQGAEITITGRSQARLKEVSTPQISTIIADLTDPSSIYLFKDNYDAIVHAADFSTGPGLPEDLRFKNFSGTNLVKTIAEQSPACHLIYISSSDVYARSRDQFEIHESTNLPHHTKNLYAWNKQQAEDILRNSRALTTILRPARIYGPHDPHLLPSILQAAETSPLPLLRGGRARADFIHVNDLVCAIHAALVQTRPVSGKIYNISDGEDFSVKGVLETICFHAGIELRWRALPMAVASLASLGIEKTRKTGKTAKYPAFGRNTLELLAWSRTLDTTRAEHNLEWIPEIPFQEGLLQTLDTFFP
jgi:nucleoside-diphosphate-sugar epimerase